MISYRCGLQSLHGTCRDHAELLLRQSFAMRKVMWMYSEQSQQHVTNCNNKFGNPVNRPLNRKMKAVGSFKTSGRNYPPTRRSNPERLLPQQPGGENFKILSTYWYYLSLSATFHCETQTVNRYWIYISVYCCIVYVLVLFMFISDIPLWNTNRQPLLHLYQCSLLYYLHIGIICIYQWHPIVKHKPSIATAFLSVFIAC